MRTPASLGLPAHKFPAWRRGQDKAVRDLLFTERRFNLVTIPTGGGKTVIYMATTGTDDGRHAILTATKGLQDQVSDGFHTMGLVDMRGRNNYVCDVDRTKTADEAVCTAGIFCPLMKQGGCAYYDQKKLAGSSRLVITNYRYWLHDEESESLGGFSSLILDEAHKAPDEIADFASVTVGKGELISFGIPQPPASSSRPWEWANRALYRIEELAKVQGNIDRRRAAFNLQRRLARLCKLSDSEWVASRPDGNRWQWDLVNPGSLAEELLFRGAQKIILVSASVRRKTLQLLGVDEQVKVIEQESRFPVIRRPIYYQPICSVGRKMNVVEAEDLYDAMDDFICRRLDRKGLLHSVSFDFAKQIYNHAGRETRKHFLVHERGQEAADVLARFRAKDPKSGTLLLSPSFDTGIDLPYEDVEYQVIPKCPYPNFGAPLIRARMARDPEYVPYVTMQRLVQSVGRGMRVEDDQCETWVGDSNFGRLRGQHWDFAPKYFHAAVKTIGKGQRVPDPPPPLRVQGYGEREAER